MHYWNFRTSEKTQKIKSSENETFDQVKNDNFDQVKFDQLTPCQELISFINFKQIFYDLLSYVTQNNL
jgi:hypothetical protein